MTVDLFTALTWLAGAFSIGLFVGLAWRPARAPHSSEEDTRP